MFLAELQPEEKEAFLELAVLISKVDGNLSIYEQTIIERYQKEMDLENYSIKGTAFEEILKVFTNERSQNIVLTEILQLIFSDGVFHVQERESVRLIKEHFKFNPSEFDSFKDWIIKIKELSNSSKKL